jgi:YlmC/YmxH family sporulation protein
MNIFLSELQEKNVISIVNGLNYGHIVDIEIDSNGNITNFIVENRKIFNTFKKTEINFKYSDIEKIGKDVILIRV